MNASRAKTARLLAARPRALGYKRVSGAICLAPMQDAQLESRAPSHGRFGRRAGFVIAAVVLVGAMAAAAQAPNFDDRPTGFLTAQNGGMPPDAWNGTSLATAKRLVSALSAAPRSRALRDLQFRVLVSELRPPASDGSPPPGL